MTDLSQLKWRCRRGVKELDLVLCHYLKHHYGDAPESEKMAFKDLLDAEDPLLFAMILENVEPANPVQKIVLTKLKNIFHGNHY